mmetsp:Transcript_19640/g.74321  ORF Transcript_19640/g.74321 Transcript_19640/m.74321 type:complete len:310 (+) Transcript_19640:906-1835(+)
MHSKASSTSSAVSAYCPRIQSATERTFGTVMSPSESMSFRSRLGRRSGYCSTMARTNSTTSSAPSVSRNSMSVWTTPSATSGKRVAHWWIERMSTLRYSAALSMSFSCVRWTSFLSSVTTSRMLRGVTRSIATSKVFSQISRLGEFRARRMSMRTSCSTLEWFRFRALRRSKMMSLTLLSPWLHTSSAKVDAAARTAVGAVVRDTSVQAASYATPGDCALIMLKRQRTKRPFRLGSARHTRRVSSSTRRPKPSPKRPMSSMLCSRKSSARVSASLHRKRKAFRRHPTSVSSAMKRLISSGASGTRCAPA